MHGAITFSFLIISELEVGRQKVVAMIGSCCRLSLPLLTPCSKVFPLEESQFNYLLTLFFCGEKKLNFTHHHDAYYFLLILLLLLNLLNGQLFIFFCGGNQVPYFEKHIFAYNVIECGLMK